MIFPLEMLCIITRLHIQNKNRKDMHTIESISNQPDYSKGTLNLWRYITFASQCFYLFIYYSPIVFMIVIYLLCSYKNRNVQWFFNKINTKGICLTGTFIYMICQYACTLPYSKCRLVQRPRKFIFHICSPIQFLNELKKYYENRERRKIK